MYIGSFRCYRVLAHCACMWLVSQFNQLVVGTYYVTKSNALVLHLSAHQIWSAGVSLHLHAGQPVCYSWWVTYQTLFLGILFIRTHTVSPRGFMGSVYANRVMCSLNSSFCCGCPVEVKSLGKFHFLHEPNQDFFCPAYTELLMEPLLTGCCMMHFVDSH